MPKVPAPDEDHWQAVLTGTDRLFMRYRFFFRLMPASKRCKFCEAPLSGIGATVTRVMGIRSSGLNPRMCNECEIIAERYPGGAEVELAMLFADVRGSTSLAESMSAMDFSHLISRFYNAGGTVMAESDALIDKLMGDQVSGFYLPAFAGPDYCQKAIGAGLDLLRAVGYGTAEGPWLPIGVGVHVGQAYVGSVTSESGLYDITALGDAVNIAARLASNAGPGELVMSHAIYDASGMDLGALDTRDLEIKGRHDPIAVHVVRAEDVAEQRPTT